MTAPSSGNVRSSHVVGAVIGIALEVYDFTTFSYFAVAISHTFFPTKSQFLSLMLSLGTVGVGFLSRPIGAFALGRYADRVGRTPAMFLSFALMGVGIAVLCLTPGYAQIGIAAPLVVLMARLTQGFALGGEVGATTAYLLEAAPEEERGFYCSLQYCGQGMAAVLAGLVGFALASFLSAHALDSYGWRIAMALGALVLPIGLVLRWSAPETLHRTDGGYYGSQARQNRETRRIFLTATIIIGASAAGSQVFRYLTTYSIAFLHLPTDVSLAIPAVSGLFVMTCGVVGGALSDLVGRRAIMIPMEIVVVALTMPVFYVLVHVVSLPVFYGSIAALSIFSAIGAGATIVAITESLPKHVRSTVFALSYAIAQATMGGVTQPLVTWLIHASGDPLMLGWYALAAAVIGLAAKLTLAESAPRRLLVAQA